MTDLINYVNGVNSIASDGFVKAAEPTLVQRYQEKQRASGLIRKLLDSGYVEKTNDPGHPLGVKPVSKKIEKERTGLRGVLNSLQSALHGSGDSINEVHSIQEFLGKYNRNQKKFNNVYDKLYGKFNDHTQYYVKKLNEGEISQEEFDQKLGDVNKKFFGQRDVDNQAERLKRYASRHLIKHPSQTFEGGGEYGVANGADEFSYFLNNGIIGGAGKAYGIADDLTLNVASGALNAIDYAAAGAYNNSETVRNVADYAAHDVVAAPFRGLHNAASDAYRGDNKSFVGAALPAITGVFAPPASKDDIMSKEEYHVMKEKNPLDQTLANYSSYEDYVNAHNKRYEDWSKGLISLAIPTGLGAVGGAAKTVRNAQRAKTLANVGNINSKATKAMNVGSKIAPKMQALNTGSLANKSISGVRNVTNRAGNAINRAKKHVFGRKGQTRMKTFKPNFNLKDNFGNFLGQTAIEFGAPQFAPLNTATQLGGALARNFSRTNLGRNTLSTLGRGLHTTADVGLTLPDTASDDDMSETLTQNDSLTNLENKITLLKNNPNSRRRIEELRNKNETNNFVSSQTRK